ASSTPIFVAASGTASWSLALPVSMLTAGDSYTVTSQATDAAGNVQSPVSTVSWTFSVAADTTPPTSTITYPAEGLVDVATWTGAITGTATDPDGASDVALVQVSVFDRIANQYWNGQEFVDSS